MEARNLFTPRARVTVGLWLLLFLSEASIASAHTVGISRGDYQLQGTEVTAALTFARPELLVVLPQLDADKDGTLTEQEVADGKPLLEQTLVQAVRVRASSAPCAGSLHSAGLTEADGLSIHAIYRCPVQPEAVSFTLQFLESLTHGHRHLVTMTANEATRQSILYIGNADFTLLVGSNRQREQNLSLPLVWSFFCLGLEHILTGYDHLVFLFGLLLVAGQFRLPFRVVTAFTIAHSLTLSLAVLGVWAPSPTLVEPAIALSIAYIGVENWFARDAGHRWLITFPFGLIHGFGFAGALQEVALPQGHIPVALVAFNLGVEMGQIAVLLGVLLTLWWLRRQSWFVSHGMQIANAGIVVAGAWWFVARVA